MDLLDYTNSNSRDRNEKIYINGSIKKKKKKEDLSSPHHQKLGKKKSLLNLFYKFK